MYNFLMLLSSRSRYRSGIFFAAPASGFFSVGSGSKESKTPGSGSQALHILYICFVIPSTYCSPAELMSSLRVVKMRSRSCMFTLSSGNG